jgi:hypothetical protein
MITLRRILSHATRLAMMNRQDAKSAKKDTVRWESASYLFLLDVLGGSTLSRLFICTIRTAKRAIATGKTGRKTEFRLDTRKSRNV